MFIHKEKSIGGFKFRQPYPKSFGALAGSLHLGVDWRSYYEPIYAPVDGKVTKISWGTQGGWWIYFEETKEASKYNANKLIHRFGHCDPIVKLNDLKSYKAGQIIGYSGNTGSASSGPHTHHDISKDKVDIYNINNFIDPEEYFNNLDSMNLSPWEQNAINWGKETEIVSEPSNSPFTLKQTAWILEVLRKFLVYIIRLVKHEK